MTTNQQLNKLFSYWQAESFTENFVKDGIMLLPNKTDEEIDQMWKSSPLRIAYLLKDNNQEGGTWDDDARTWLIHKESGAKTRELKKMFWRRLAELHYGLTHSSKEQLLWGDEVDNNLDTVKECFSTTPFAFVECKKQPGINYIEDVELNAYIEKYRWFLEMELRTIDPNILVCMGHPQYDFVRQIYAKYEIINIAVNKKNNVAHLYYIPAKRTVVLLAGHPSVQKGGYVDYYEGVYWAYSEFVNSEYFEDFILPKKA